MIRKIVKLPVIACGIAGWTVVIGCLYAQYIKDSIIHKKKECKYHCCNKQ